MKLAIQKHWKDFVAILALIVVSGGVAAFILVHERLTLPSWVPSIGNTYHQRTADLTNAQAVTPGQGQTLTIAGVNVGEISKVRLVDGKARITFNIRPKYDTVYKDATILMRPKTGLKDMVAELNPGTPGAGKLPQDQPIPISQTLPDVNLDEILATLDADTRDYLKLLVGGAAEGLRGKGQELGDVLRRFEPTARDLEAINGQLATRRNSIKRVMHNLSLITDELGNKDDQLASFVQNSNEVFRILSAQDASLRSTLQQLPPSLQVTSDTLGKAKTLADTLGPTLSKLRPAARALGPSLRQTRPFLRETIKPIRDQIRPFTRAANPTVTELRPAMRDLAAATPDLTRTFKVVNYLLNTLAYNPPGDTEEGYLFWLSWANHLGASVFATQDAHGPIRHGVFIATCNTLDLLDSVSQADPQLGTLVGLLNTPRQAICPEVCRGDEHTVNTQSPGIGRIAAMVVFALSCFGLLLFLWLAFGGPIPLKPKGYRFHASFAEATQLAKEADVRISGVPVGKVKTIVADKKTGRSDAVIKLQSRYAPLPADSKAILRQKTLLGETYVELTPGTKSGPKVKENGQLATTQISPTVELDEIYRSFDERTRRAFQVWMQSQAGGIKGHGRDLNDALGNLGPFAEDAAVLVGDLNREEAAVKRLISNTGVVFNALTDRKGQLRELIQNSNLVFATTAARDKELEETFTAFPTFERESRTTLARLTKYAKNTDPLITQLRPAARELSPTLTDLAGLAPDAKAFFRELGPLITASKTGFPAAQRLLDETRPTVAQLDPTLRQVVPILDFLGLYKRELGTFFANVVATTQAFDVTPGSNPPEKVHYLRTLNPLNPENLAQYPRRIGTNRSNPYMLPGNYDLLKTKGYLQVYDNRSCGRGVPVLSQVLSPIVSQVLGPDLLKRVDDFAFPATNAAQSQTAPPCELQDKFNVAGEITRYPHVRVAPSAVR